MTATRNVSDCFAAGCPLNGTDCSLTCSAIPIVDLDENGARGGRTAGRGGAAGGQYSGRGGAACTTGIPDCGIEARPGSGEMAPTGWTGLPLSPNLRGWLVASVELVTLIAPATCVKRLSAPACCGFSVRTFAKRPTAAS